MSSEIEPLREKVLPRSSSKLSDDLELLVKVIAVVAGVLPVVGAGVRAIAFALAGVQNPLDLAVRVPVGVLAGTALKATGPGVVLVVLLAYTSYRGWMSFNIYRPPDLTGAGRRWGRAWRLLLWAVPILWILGNSPWPGGVVLSGGAAFAGWLLGRWAARHEVTFYRSAVLVLVVGLVTAVGAGISGWVVSDAVNDYTFVPSSVSLADGRYSLVGESDGFIYLNSCLKSGIVAVSQQNVVKFAAAAPKVPPSTSLFEVVFAGASPKVGYQLEC